jgi:signal transduction histidine kinase
VSAADGARRRIERNLHDGAQQHLVALAVKVRLVQQLAASDPVRAGALLDELGQDLQGAIDELRSLAHGIYPPLLSSRGLAEALAAACRRATIPAELVVEELGRYPPELESAIYFCCVEALQNGAKHAGTEATAQVRVWEEARTLRFEVRDDGTGFDLNGARLGAGLTNMADRLGAVGGFLDLDSAPGRGTVVGGRIPLPPKDAEPTRANAAPTATR